MKTANPETLEKRNTVLETIASHPKGLALDELLKLLGSEIPVNALKAHCRILLDSGKIRRETEPFTNGWKTRTIRNRYFAVKEQA